MSLHGEPEGVRVRDGRGAGENQKGFDAGAYWQYVIDNDTESTLDAKYWSIGPMVEYVRFWDNGGTAGQTAEYFTLGIITNDGNWQADVTWGFQNVSGADGVGSNSLNTGRTELFTANIGYNFFGPQSLVQLGYAYNDSGGQVDHQIGLQVNLPINMLQYFPIGD